MNSINQTMRAANPVPDAAIALADDDFEALLLVSQTRSGNMDVKEIAVPVEPESPKGSRWLVAAAAFAAVVVVVGAAVLLISPTTETEPATPPTTEATVDQSTITDAEAIAVKDAYFEAYAAGDVEAMLGLFAPDATIYAGPGYGLSEFEQYVTWDLAQGTTNEPATCSVEDIVQGVIDANTVKLVCDYKALQSLVAAVDGLPSPIQLTFYITPNGISTLAEGVGNPLFRVINDPFKAWMNVHHPEEASDIGFGSWSNLDEAERFGLSRVQFGKEWAAYLKANGCTYPDLDC